MDLEKYQELTGTTVSTNDQTRVTAVINRVKRKLESMLGFTLTPANVNDNEYTEIGKTSTNCPCVDDIDIEDLLDADAVVYAYRMYNYNKKDVMLKIDPCTAVHKVKLVKDGITLYTLDSDDYRIQYKNGVARYIELCQSCYSCVISCDCSQLAIDADWVWDDADDIPEELLYVWSDMVAYYSDPKLDVKSETLGPHSYSVYAKDKPEEVKENMAVLKKYAGPNGSLHKVVTV